MNYIGEYIKSYRGNTSLRSFADKCGMHKVALKRILGHTLSDITDHYTHKNLDELKAEINKLQYK